MRQKINFILIVLISLFALAPGFSLAVKPSDFGLKEGNVISTTGDPDVYIINDSGFKRLFVNPQIFNLYGHLGWDKIKKVSAATRDAFITSGLFRNCESNDPKVYGLEVLSEDVANLRWVNTSGSQAIADDPDFFKKVFCINSKEFALYSAASQYSSVKEIPKYERGAVSQTPTPTPVPTSTPAPTPTPTPITSPTPTNLTVTLAADNPASTNVPIGVTGVPFLKFKVSGIETLNEVVITRNGLGTASDFDAVYLYDGATRLSGARTVNPDDNKVTFVNLSLAVGAGKTLTVKVDVNNSSANLISRQDAFSLTSINGAAVSGINGNLMIYANVTVATAIVANTSTSWEVSLDGKGTELAKFSVQESGGISNLTVSGVTLRHNGTLDENYIKNLVLQAGSTILASCSALTDDKAVFVFSSPYTVPKGDTKRFVVYGDITGGNVNNTVQFYLDTNSDLNAADTNFGYGAIVTNNWDQSSAAKTQTITVGGTQITLNFAGPTSGKYTRSSTAQEFLNFSISSPRNVTVKKVKVGIVVKSAGTGINSDDADYNRVKNIKIVDASSGNILVGPLSSASLGTTWSGSAATGYYKISSDQFNISAGITKNLSLRADIDANFTADRSIEMQVDFSGSNYIYETDSEQNILSSKIIPNILSGNQMTVTAASLNLVKASTPASTTVVKGATNVEALGIILTAGVGGSVRITKLGVRVYADGDGSFNNDGYGDVAANTIIQTLNLYDDAGTLIKGPVNLSSVGSIGSSGAYYKAEFSNLTYDISAGVQKMLIVKANLLNTFTGTKYFALDILPSGDVEAEDSKQNYLNLSTQTNNLNLAASPNTMITCSQAGSLAVDVDAGTPSESIIVAGTQGTVFAKYKFSSTNEAMIVKGLKLVNSSSNYDRNFDKVILSYTNFQGNTEEKTSYLSNGSLNFTDGQLGIYVPKDNSSVLTIKSDLKTIAGGANSGDAPRITLVTSGGKLTDDFVAEGASSGNKIYGASNNIVLDNVNVKQMIVRKSKPSLSSVSSSDTILSSGEKTFYQWSVAANLAGDINWKLITFNVTGILGNGTNLLTIGTDDSTIPVGYNGIYTIINGDGGANADAIRVSNIKVYKGNDEVAGTMYYRSQITASDVGGYYLVFVPNSEQQIAAGIAETYSLRGNFSVVSTGVSNALGSISVKIADLAQATSTNTYDNIAGANDANNISVNADSIPAVSFVWTDKSASGHSAVTSDWANDYRISGIPTTTLTLSK